MIDFGFQTDTFCNNVLAFSLYTMAMLSDCLILQDLWQEIIFGSFWLKEKCNGDVVYYLEKKVKVCSIRKRRLFVLHISKTECRFFFFAETMIRKLYVIG
jgi:hypothetical protein